MLILARVVIGRSLRCVSDDALRQSWGSESADYQSVRSSDNAFTVFGSHHSYPAYVLHCGPELGTGMALPVRERQCGSLRNRSLQLQQALDQCQNVAGQGAEAVSGSVSCGASSCLERASVSSFSTWRRRSIAPDLFPQAQQQPTSQPQAGGTSLDWSSVPMDVGTDADLQRKLCQFKDVLRHVKLRLLRLVRNTHSQEGRAVSTHTYSYIRIEVRASPARGTQSPTKPNPVVTLRL